MRNRLQANLKPGAKPLRILCRELYAYEGLEGGAKERARQWLVDAAHSDGCLNGWRESCLTDLEALGFTMAQEPTRHNTASHPRFYYSLGHCQGDGVAFDAKADLADVLQKANADAMQEHAPQGDLPCLPAELENQARRLLACDPEGRARIRVKAAGLRSTLTDVDLDVERQVLPENEEAAAAVLEAEVALGLADWVGRLCNAFERSGYDELDYLAEEEQLREMAQANSYLFTETGVRDG